MGTNNWKIYKMENTLNGMTFIGKTDGDVTESIRREVSKTCLLGKHVSDFGLNSFKVDVLEENLDDISVLSKRMLYIKKYNCRRPRGYNDVQTLKKSY